MPFFDRILVNMDDRMVQQFVNEDDFVIQMVFDNQLGHCDLYLHYWLKIWTLALSLDALILENLRQPVQECELDQSIALHQY